MDEHIDAGPFLPHQRRGTRLDMMIGQDDARDNNMVDKVELLVVEVYE